MTWFNWKAWWWSYKGRNMYTITFKLMLICLTYLWSLLYRRKHYNSLKGREILAQIHSVETQRSEAKFTGLLIAWNLVKDHRSVSHIFRRLTSKTGLWHDTENICVRVCSCVLINLSEPHWAVSLCTFRRQIYCCYATLISSIYVRYLVLWEDFLNQLKHSRHYIN